MMQCNNHNTGPCPSCPLCSGESTAFSHAWKRDYFLCNTCSFVFVPFWQHLSRQEERSRYLNHNNDPDDERYQKFLLPVARAVMRDHSPPSRGLDFGCGTGSPLPLMLEALQFEMDVYDPFFAPYTEIFDRRYDFITCTEVVEHMSAPAVEINRLWEMLNPGGGLYLMTQLRLPGHDFISWGYIRDTTHISFFAPSTMKWLARHLSAKLTFPAASVSVLQKR